MTTYKVLEDNGGGLHLFVFRGLRVIAGYSNFEYAPGTLTPCLDALDDGDDMHTWDGAIDKPRSAWDKISGSEYGWEIVAEGGRNKTRHLYKARMGRSAQREFGVSDDERYAAPAKAEGSA